MRKITRGEPYPLGATITEEGISFSFVSSAADCGVVLYNKKTFLELERIAFPAEYRTGDIHFMHISGLTPENTAYCFYEKERDVTDRRGKAFLHTAAFGMQSESLRLATFLEKEYDWEGEETPCIPYSQAIGYCMHVRGFTKHPSSKVKEKGTFQGIIRKIPYLKELGITTLELQPAYEFDELDGDKVNYWGYQKGYYYSPKASYAYADAGVEFKDMVKALHKEQMEVIMQFYFTQEVSKHEIVDILSYWVAEYHVDGFHLKGANIDTEMLMHEPALSRTKLWYYSFPVNSGVGEYPVSAERSEGISKRLASYTEEFQYAVRRFLKGDAGMVSAVMYHMRHNPFTSGQINYLTNYDGFTLKDLVSYNIKHNEPNGENNRDGAAYNASWNCGQEGDSRKQEIKTLRLKQMKNALLLLFLSQGMPLFFMGDEFGNSQQGNNNPYCQDNEITWLNWNNQNSAIGKELLAFFKQVIVIRKAHPVFRQDKELRMTDYQAHGTPDISYHGSQAFKPDTSTESRQLGVLYCGDYVKDSEGVSDAYFYVAYNMHWETKTFALPKLPKGMVWSVCITTETGVDLPEMENASETTIPGRCICVLKSVGERKQKRNESRTAF